LTDARAEAERLIAFMGSPQKAFDVLERQLGVLVIRSQVLLSLCGIVITVTGFSGRAIAATGMAARVLIVAGLAIVLLAAAVVVGGVFRVTWLTQHLGEDERASIVSCIEVRESKTRYLKAGLVLFLGGFALYVAAVSMLLVLG
jgi:hypothetical protein